MKHFLQKLHCAFAGHVPCTIRRTVHRWAYVSLCEDNRFCVRCHKVLT